MTARRGRGGALAPLLVALVVVAATAGCSDDDDPIDEPATTPAVGLDRIDGPAQVDPSYDPFTTGG